MHCTSEEAKNKVCIHIRDITPDGKCMGNGCMAWTPINKQIPFDGPDDQERLSVSQPFKVIPTDKGYCCFSK